MSPTLIGASQEEIESIFGAPGGIERSAGSPYTTTWRYYQAGSAFRGRIEQEVVFGPDGRVVSVTRP